MLKSSQICKEYDGIVLTSHDEVDINGIGRKKVSSLLGYIGHGKQKHFIYNLVLQSPNWV